MYVHVLVVASVHAQQRDRSAHQAQRHSNGQSTLGRPLGGRSLAVTRVGGPPEGRADRSSGGRRYDFGRPTLVMGALVMGDSILRISEGPLQRKIQQTTVSGSEWKQRRKLWPLCARAARSLVVTHAVAADGLKPNCKQASAATHTEG